MYYLALLCLLLFPKHISQVLLSIIKKATAQCTYTYILGGTLDSRLLLWFFVRPGPLCPTNNGVLFVVFKLENMQINNDKVGKIVWPTTRAGLASVAQLGPRGLRGTNP